jgi:hypothetical protein
LAGLPGGGKTFAPLLFHILAGRNVRIAEGLNTYLRTAALWEQMRVAEYRNITRQVISAMADAGIPVLLVKGAVLSAMYYPREDVRHCHDIDLMVSRENVMAAVEHLEAQGFTSDNADNMLRQGTFCLRHPDGLPVLLHTRFFSCACYESSMQGAWQRSMDSQIHDSQVRILCPEDMFLHICGQGMAGAQRGKLIWISDAWHVIKQAPQLDWNAIRGRSENSRLILSCAAFVSYLTGRLGADIKPSVLQGMVEGARRQDSVAQELALIGVFRNHSGGVSSYIAGQTRLTDKARALKALLLPAPTTLQCLGILKHKWGTPGVYLARPAGYLLQRMTQILHRVF